MMVCGVVLIGSIFLAALFYYLTFVSCLSLIMVKAVFVNWRWMGVRVFPTYLDSGC